MDATQADELIQKAMKVRSNRAVEEALAERHGVDTMDSRNARLAVRAELVNDSPRPLDHGAVNLAVHARVGRPGAALRSDAIGGPAFVAARDLADIIG